MGFRRDHRLVWLGYWLLMQCFFYFYNPYYYRNNENNVEEYLAASTFMPYPYCNVSGNGKIYMIYKYVDSSILLLVFLWPNFRTHFKKTGHVFFISVEQGIYNWMTLVSICRSRKLNLIIQAKLNSNPHCSNNAKTGPGIALFISLIVYW